MLLDGRAPGTFVLRVLKAGTPSPDYQTKPAFGGIANLAHAAVVTLRDEEYPHFITAVADPAVVAALLGPR